jgi:hypothetical protein
MNKDNAHLYLPLVQALAEGKTLQCNGGTAQEPDWQDIHTVSWVGVPEDYRIKRLDFAPIPDGATRHNPNGLTPEQVGEGYRLILESEFGEIGRSEPFVQRRDYGEWKDNNGVGFWPQHRDRSFRVPLSTPYPDGSVVKDGKLVKPWKPRFKVGDRVVIKPLNESGRVEQSASEKHFVSRGSIQISAWWNESDLEPAPEPTKVPLTAEDVPAGSLFCHPNHPDIFCTPLQISSGGIVTYNGHDHSQDIGEYPKDGGGKAGVWHRSWETLQKDGWLIHRPGNLDANGKPVFEPCWKEGAPS